MCANCVTGRRDVKYDVSTTSNMSNMADKGAEVGEEKAIEIGDLEDR